MAISEHFISYFSKTFSDSFFENLTIPKDIITGERVLYKLADNKEAERREITQVDIEQFEIFMEKFCQVSGGRKVEVGSGVGLDFDELGVSEVVELLDVANMEAVVRDFGDRNPQEDPIIHFYERFLKEYDAKKRMQRGVFYTPRPVVSFIVRSLDEILRTEFGLADGLADTTTWGEMVERFDDLEIPKGATPRTRLSSRSSTLPPAPAPSWWR